MTKPIFSIFSDRSQWAAVRSLAGSPCSFHLIAGAALMAHLRHPMELSCGFILISPHLKLILNYTPPRFFQTIYHQVRCITFSYIQRPIQGVKLISTTGIGRGATRCHIYQQRWKWGIIETIYLGSNTIPAKT